ncbi:MAG: InlB B-repeat-containing protein [Eubacteriales bacterium]
MRKIRLNILCFVCALILLSVSVAAAYPSSEYTIPEGSVLLTGEYIGEKNGWDGTEGTGCKAAFDGDIHTYYDPTIGANTDYYTGIKLSEPYFLTQICIMPRENFNDRFEGAMIQGSNDGKKWNTLWQSNSAASSWGWQVVTTELFKTNPEEPAHDWFITVTDFKNNTGYTYYRYCNDRNHGDVAEIELYGYSIAPGEDPVLASASKLNNITVQFETCGGEISAFYPITVQFGENYPEIEYVPVREGYVFDGWYTSMNGGKRVDSDTEVTDPSRHTLYAHWIAEDEYALSVTDESITEEDTEEVFSDIQGACITISIAFVLAAAVAIIAFRKKN